MEIIDFPASIPLERCLRTVVRVLSTTPSGPVEQRGLLLLLHYPWHVLIVDVDSMSSQGTAVMAMSWTVPFIGEDGAILRIGRGRMVAYANPDLPRPYPSFDIRSEADRRVINELRRSRFGAGYDYDPPPPP